MIDKKKLKMAVVVSHPIQHFCPQYVSFNKNKEVNFKVFFGSTLGLTTYVDPNFKTEVSWGNLYLDQFDHMFLNGENAIPSTANLDAVSLENELSKYNPDIVIIYGYFQKLQRRAHHWATTNKRKLAYISDSELRHKRNPLKEYFKYFFIKRYFSKITYFLSIGDANEIFYKKYGVKNSQIIRMHFPIDIKLYEKSFEQRDVLRKKIRELLDIKENEIVVSVVGKLVSWKNQDHIIDAIKLLENEGIYMQLFIVGSGEMMESWKKKAIKLKYSKVYFTGFVKIEELPAYYAASDLYVHPALIEPHSIAISEAIYMGCPIIISDRCGSYGPSDDVQEGKNGYVFEFGNIPQLAEKLKILVKDLSIKKKFSTYSHKTALNIQKIAHYEILKNLIAAVSNSLSATEIA